jgi:hypothetical protein
MANILQITSGANFTIDGVLEYQDITRQQSITLTGDTVVRIRQTIGFAAHEALVTTDLSSYGWGRFWNKDDANFVQVGTDVSAAFEPFLELLPGEWSGWMRFPSGIVLYAKADTGAVDLVGELTAA